MLADVRVILLVEDDKMDEYLSPHMELKTLRVYGLINEELGFHTIKIRRAFRHSVPFLKDFGEPMSVGAKVILLVEDDAMGKYLRLLCTLWFHGHINEEMDFHTTKIRRAFRRLVPFSKEFREPMSIGVKVILLVGHDKTLHVPCKVGNSK